MAVSRLWFCQCTGDIIVSWICRTHFLEKTMTKTSLTSYFQMRTLVVQHGSTFGGQVTHVPVVRRLIDFRQIPQSYMGPVGLGIALSTMNFVLGARENARPHSESARDLQRMP